MTFSPLAPPPPPPSQWVQDGSPAHANNAIKIDNPHQFVPVAMDASEFRKKQKEVMIIGYFSN